MKIVVAARCYNNVEYVDRFLRGYDFADQIVISDGGSTDGSIEALTNRSKVTLLHFGELKEKNGRFYNQDAPHMNFVLDYAKSLNPDFLIFDDFDCIPNKNLRESARGMIRFVYEMGVFQINAFRLYLWGDDQYFPSMNNYFDSSYTSVWGWRPDKVNIYADPNTEHGTLLGLTTNWSLKVPQCLLHKSWHPDTIQAKIDKYNAIGLPMNHPLNFAGMPEKLPLWAVED